MVALLPGTPIYDEIFAGAKIPLSAASSFPTYGMLSNALLNPANNAALGKLELLNAQQCKDLQLASRYIFEGLSVFRAGKATGLPELMLGGLKDLMKSVEVEASLPDAEVFDRVLNANTPREAAGYVLGSALALLGISVPVVGAIAGLVVGLATAIYRALERGTMVNDPESEAAKNLLYQYFPPLQIADADTDAALVNGVIRPAMESGDWTHLYMPRWQGEWHGEERDGGFQFGCGTAIASEKFDGSMGESFDPTGGLGCVPGTATIVDLVQVCLPHKPAQRNDVAKAFYGFLRGGKDPRNADPAGVLGKSRVFDTGAFYPMSARLCGMLWTWIMQRDNPMMFRVDPLRLAPKWRKYCESGLEFIRRVCYPWVENNLMAKVYAGKVYYEPHGADYRIDPNANFEGYFGTAIFHQIGVWACSRTGMHDKPPKYYVEPVPGGRLGSQLGQPGTLGVKQPPAYGQLYTEVWSENSGPFLPIFDAARWPDQCMGTRWDRGPLSIRKALDQLRNRQRWALKGSAVAVAACSRTDAAFVGDAKLEEELLASRAILLKHRARFSLNLDDVRQDEPGVPGMEGSWRDQLAKAGVTTHPKHLSTAISLTLGGAPPPPPKPDFMPTNGDPWDPSPPAPPKRRGRAPRPKPGGGDGSGAGVMVAAVAAAGVLGTAVVTATRKKRGRRG